MAMGSRRAADAAILAVLVLLLTPHAAVVRAQVLDMVTSVNGSSTAAAVAVDGSDAAAAAAASGGNASVVAAINAAGGNITSVVEMFRASSNATSMAQADDGGGGGGAAAAPQPQTLAGQKVANAADRQAAAQQAKEQKQAAKENLANKVPDRIVTGLNETEFALFLADFRENFGSGANIQELRTLWQETNVYQAHQLAVTVYNTLTAAAQLGIAALQAGPFAVIGLIVIALGLASAITSLIGGILYAAASGIGLYISIVAAIQNQCAAAGPGTGTGTGDPGAVAETDTGTDTVPLDPGTGGAGASSATGKNKKPNQNKPAVNCFDVQKQASKWLQNALKQSNKLNKYLMPYVFRGGVDDGLLAVTEGILRGSINLAKMVQSVA